MQNTLTAIPWHFHSRCHASRGCSVGMAVDELSCGQDWSQVKVEMKALVDKVDASDGKVGFVVKAVKDKLGSREQPGRWWCSRIFKGIIKT
jgi:hypothetical protein